jgi:hypothetical protein
MTEDLPTRLRDILSRKPKTEEETERFIDDLEKIINALYDAQMAASREMLRKKRR